MAKPIDNTNELKPEWVQNRLQRMPGWVLERPSLAQAVEFPTVQAATLFAHQVAQLAIEEGRQPDIRIEDRTVTLRVSTPETGVTEADMAFVEHLVAAYPLPEPN